MQKILYFDVKIVLMMTVYLYIIISAILYLHFSIVSSFLLHSTLQLGWLRWVNVPFRLI